MILERFYHEGLAHASYLIGCPGVGEAVVVDPNRDIDPYIETAAKHGMRIVGIAETHIHADYLSGSRELSAATGATMFLSDEGDADWKYAFANDPKVKLVRHGDSFKIGAIRFDVLKSQGHTPEHITFLLTDEATSSEPLGAFTGDFVFVGDVGRPDLLEQAAGIKGTQEPGARRLYESLQSFRRLPDHLLIWPAHGAGSACGKSLGGVPVSSLGYERVANWAFQIGDEETFVAEVLAGQPEPPAYFARMKHLNRVGPTVLGAMPSPIHRHNLQAAVAAGEIVLDVRPTAEYVEAHVKGSLHVPLAKGFVTWAGSLLPYDQDITLLAADQAGADRAARELAMIGIDRVTGWHGPAELAEFAQAGGAITAFPTTMPTDASADQCVLDVRNASEWREHRLQWATHIPLGFLPRRLDELPRDKPIVIHCAGGVRAVVAASVLERAGFTNARPIRATFADIAACQISFAGSA